MTLNLYLLEQDVNDDYDTFDSCVVAAENEDDARLMHPHGLTWTGETWEGSRFWGVWAPPDNVSVELIGVAAPTQTEGLIIASFNAG